MLSVITRLQPTVRRFHAQLLSSSGTPVLSSASTILLEDRVHRLLPSLGTKMLIADELTLRQAEKVDILKQELPVFSCMRSLAMRFRGFLRGKRTTALDEWSCDAIASGIHAMQRFAFKLCHDIDAVRIAIREKWSNGQTEGQINRLKVLERAMYGRASKPLLYARMRPLHELE